MNELIQNIIHYKQEEIRYRKQQVPLRRLRQVISDRPPTLDFRKALKQNGDIAVIAEIKRASPSAGIICHNFDAVEIAESYQRNGAAAISVLTDEKFFGGQIGHIPQVRSRIKLPILRKDFILDPYQLYETRAAGADAVLLIAAILTPSRSRELLDLAAELGLAVLFEVHNLEELQISLNQNCSIIGINNRDLRTMQVNLQTTLELASRIPQELVCVSESGLRSRADLEKLSPCGIDAILIGETLMSSPDPGGLLRKFLGVSRCLRSKSVASPI
ncbi:MAG: indole-3-glycerol phosphate synthase TrpC [candidate division KSB1 bacterium]|nr:indole-3-glycerol phosphate synthase TrpC [candidate division KSB1 bacterium]